MIASENAAEPHAAQRAGDVEIKKEDIATRDNTRRSLMPEGLEALGAEALRDILTFLAGDGTTRSSASSICARPTRRTAAAGSAAKTNATRR